MSWLHDWIHAPDTHAAMDVLIAAAVRNDVHTTNYREVHTGGFGDGTPDMWAPEPEPWESEPEGWDDMPEAVRDGR